MKHVKPIKSGRITKSLNLYPPLTHIKPIRLDTKQQEIKVLDKLDDCCPKSERHQSKPAF